MVNIERSFSQRKEPTRKIEVYRKNTSSLDEETNEQDYTNNPTRKKTNIFEIFKFCFGMFIIFFVGVIVVNLLFPNPFGELQKEAKQEPVNKIRIEQATSSSGQPEPQVEGFFRNKDGSPKKLNFILTAAGAIAIARALSA